MHLVRNKSYKKDAGWICRYAIEQKAPYWEMPDSACLESKQLYNTIREYTEMIKRFNNELHSLKLLPVPSKDTIKSLEKVNKQLEKEIKLLKIKLEAMLEQWQPAQLKSVGSIKGIGKRTQGFKYTHSHRQLISFAGLSPTEYSSCSSIHGKARIYKRGGKNLRDVLYMCSMNAIKTNTACNTLYERLRANGKTGKQALIAVCNKLLKQVFAMVKNNSLYQPNYCSPKP